MGSSRRDRCCRTRRSPTSRSGTVRWFRVGAVAASGSGCVVKVESGPIRADDQGQTTAIGRRKRPHRVPQRSLKGHAVQSMLKWTKQVESSLRRRELLAVTNHSAIRRSYSARLSGVSYFPR